MQYYDNELYTFSLNIFFIYSTNNNHFFSDTTLPSDGTDASTNTNGNYNKLYLVITSCNSHWFRMLVKSNKVKVTDNSIS